jgi:hypothetical protein
MEATTLKGICAELKIDPRVARDKLRAAIREPKKWTSKIASKLRSSWKRIAVERLVSYDRGQRVAASGHSMLQRSRNQ